MRPDATALAPGLLLNPRCWSGPRAPADPAKSIRNQTFRGTNADRPPGMIRLLLHRVSPRFGGAPVECTKADDPHNVKEGESDAKRSDVLLWWDESMSTRKNDPNNWAIETANNHFLKGPFTVLYSDIHKLTGCHPGIIMPGIADEKVKAKKGFSLLDH